MFQSAGIKRRSQAAQQPMSRLKLYFEKQEKNRKMFLFFFIKHISKFIQLQKSKSKKRAVIIESLAGCATPKQFILNAKTKPTELLSVILHDSLVSKKTHLLIFSIPLPFLNMIFFHELISFLVIDF